MDWERGGGWWTGHTGSGMKETQRGGGTRTSRPTGCIGILLKEDHFMTKNQMRGGGGQDRWWPETLYESNQPTSTRGREEEILTLFLSEALRKELHRV